MNVIQYFGGKGKMFSKIVPILENIRHDIYVEVFGGGGVCLLNKKPNKAEVYNDIDKYLYDFFTLLINKKEFEEFYKKAALLPCSKQIFENFVSNINFENNKVNRVLQWFYCQRNSFGGMGKTWRFFKTIKGIRRNMSGVVSSWLTCIDKLPEIHNRLLRVQIECRDWRDILNIYDSKNTLFYLDPPYVITTRKSGNYNYELTDKDHEELVNMLLKIKGKAVLSGYANKIYKKLEDNNWNRIDFDISHGKNYKRTESIWIKNRINNKTKTISDFLGHSI